MDSGLETAAPSGTLGPAFPGLDPDPPTWRPEPEAPPADEEPLPDELLADLHSPDLVLHEAYVGPERRRRGLPARVGRVTFPSRRAALRLEALLLVLVLGVVAAVGATLGVFGRSPAASARDGRPAKEAKPLNHGAAATSTPSTVGSVPAATTPPTPTTVAPVQAATPTPTTAPAPAPAATAPPAPAAPIADPTPQQLGAEALALVRYPWQQIPGYSIQFQPISDAPSPGFYGNTTFTWGRTGGTSVLYVYPGETVERLAGITAFEIAHEVDAAAVQPEGGEAQIENVLGIHPASWAPNCDCAEQGYLSGWYAAAFSNYWSPGVGNWSAIAPLPTGATLAAIEPWLNPQIP